MNVHNTSYLSGDQILRWILCGETTVLQCTVSLQCIFFNQLITFLLVVHPIFTTGDVYFSLMFLWLCDHVTSLTHCGSGKQGFRRWKTTPLCLLLAWSPYLLFSWAVWACSLLLGSNKRIICTPPYLSEGAVMSLVRSSVSFFILIQLQYPRLGWLGH